MPEVPNGLAGSITLAALIGFGIFLYPWLLKRRSGATVAVITVALAVLFFIFDSGSGNVGLSVALALLWAAGPLAAGVIVYRLQRR